MQRDVRHVVRQVYKEGIVFIFGDESNGLTRVALSELCLIRGTFNDYVVANQRTGRRLALKDSVAGVAFAKHTVGRVLLNRRVIELAVG